MTSRAVESRVQLGQVLIEWMQWKRLGAMAASRVAAGLNSGGRVALDKRVYVADLIWNIAANLCMFLGF